MEHVDVAGGRIGFRRRGSDAPLLLLHGGVCDGRVWRVQLEMFADAFTVVAWDARGCGGSSDVPDDAGMGDYAERLAGFATALGLGPAHVVGHSWGSTLACELWHRRPAAVRSLVLVGAYAGWAGSLPPDDVQRRLAFALEAAEAASGGFERTSMPGPFSDAMPADRAAELAGIMAEIRPAATRTMARALAGADLRPVLPSIDVPTLLVHGEDDVRSSRAVAEELHRAIPGSRLAVLPGTGHESYLEDPAAFAAAVRPFLLSARGGAA